MANTPALRFRRYDGLPAIEVGEAHGHSRQLQHCGKGERVPVRFDPILPGVHSISSA